MILPHPITSDRLHQLKGCIYSYNIVQPPELFINNFSFQVLGNLNKVYNTNIENIIKRIFHPKDEKKAQENIKLLVQHPQSIGISTRQVIDDKGTYHDIIVFSKVSECHEDGTAKRIMSYAALVDQEGNLPKNTYSDLMEIGYHFSPAAPPLTFTKEEWGTVYLLYKDLLKTSKTLNIETENKLRNKLAIPQNWQLKGILEVICNKY